MTSEDFMPSLNHGYVQGKLYSALDKLGKYLVVPNLSLQLDDKPYIPDLCLYEPQEINPLHDQIKMTTPPLLAIEILSPTQGTLEILDKFELLFKAGAKSCWLVEPVASVVMVFNSPNQSQTFATGEVVDEVLGIRLSLGEFFTWRSTLEKSSPRNVS
jgi:Uma2 family endonuclease